MKKQIMALFALAVAQMGLAQEETSATLYGYVRGEFAFDSRQVIAAREGNYIDLASPINREITNGKDLNGLANFNGWGVESRLGVKIAGPEFFGMKSEALIESHFFGSSDASINTLALRHAYVKLSSDKVEWLVGQFWHPMFVTNVSPRTYNFNAGSPFQPFNRSPQIRFSTKGEVFRFTAAAITERDFTSAVLSTTNTKSNAAKSGLPAFHAQFQFGRDDKFVGGFGVNYKTTKAAWENVLTHLDERKNVGAFNFLAYAKAQFTENFAWQIYGNYGENSSELLELGGIGVTYNPTNNKYKLQNSRNLALWTEFYGNFSPSFEWGLFGGFSQDFGYNRSNGYYFSNFANKWQQNINTTPATANFQAYNGGVVPINTWRISPRFGWKSGNTKLAVEFDYTSTTWAGLETKTDGIIGTYATGKLKKLAKDATGDNFRVSLSLIQNF
jgi:hypothetical protein